MAELPRPLDVLIKKRDGGELSRGEIVLFLQAVVRSEQADGPARAAMLGDVGGQYVSEAQIAAFLMAVYQRGLSVNELTDLTEAMRSSGEVFDRRGLDGFLVDKHSTGGVGDKTSLLVAPIMAAAGFISEACDASDSALGSDPVRQTGEAAGHALPQAMRRHALPRQPGVPERGGRILVPMISGRALGHTGGTLDKLETIPGFQTRMSLERMAEVVRACGACIVGQTPQLVPADRILYALRDQTGTVESPYLIAASIMSKKLAADLDALVLDVKVGSGAFLPSDAALRQLAELMVATGEQAGTRTVALLTAMDQPLGRFAGNWMEVRECVDILKGLPHPLSADLIELSCVLAGWMLHLAGACRTAGDGALLAETILRSGKAYRAWMSMVTAQGGDVSVFIDPAGEHRPRHRRILQAKQDGYLARMDCKQVGWAVQRLGAGRLGPGEQVSAHAGIEMHAKIGDRVEAGQPLVTLFSDAEELLAEPMRMLAETIVVDDVPPARLPLVRDIVSSS